MPDPYAEISEADEQTQHQLAEVLELRSEDTQMLEIAENYISAIQFPEEARVVEVGCGTGAVTDFLAARPSVDEAIGVDASPVFLRKAREANSGLDSISFERGDARDLPFEEGSVDVVVYHTSLSHIPGPLACLQEAHRVLDDDGTLAVFGADYASTSIALGPHDPLQTCVEKCGDELINNAWLMRRLPSLIQEPGFERVETRSHSYLAGDNPRYIMSLVNRGAEYLAEVGQLSHQAAQDLKREADRRIDEGRFFGFLPFISVIARKPAE